MLNKSEQKIKLSTFFVKQSIQIEDILQSVTQL